MLLNVYVYVDEIFVLFVRDSEVICRGMFKLVIRVFESEETSL